MKTLWVKKYAPTDFAEYCFPDATTKVIKQLLESETIPHLLLVGEPGIGKSTLAALLIQYNNIDPIDVLTIDATLENNVDTVRERIWTFAITSSFGGTHKIVLLEEFDYMSIQAQATLREMMVRYSDDVRFILTANLQYKVIEAIQSRCQTITFNAMSVKTAYVRLTTILTAERVSYTDEQVLAVLADTLPDFRRAINTAQLSVVADKAGNLTLLYSSAQQLSKHSAVARMIIESEFAELQSWIIDVAAPCDLDDKFYRTVFQNIHQCTSITASWDKLDKAILAIAKYQFQQSTSADVTICAAALISEFRLISRGQ